MIQNILTENYTSSQQSFLKNADEFTGDRHTIARVEMNFEKLPIWSPKPKRATVFTPSKTIELEPERLASGQLVTRKVEIVPSAKYGYPTTQTQEYWYALQKLWHESPDKETGRIEFSRREVIEILGKSYGRNARRSFDLSINQLCFTGFRFEHLIYDKEQDITHHEVRNFHLIVDSSLTKREKSDEIIHDKCSVTLNPLIVSNLRSNFFKPVLLSVVSQIKSDIARLLYRKLDTQFSHYLKYEISSLRFFREHGLQGSDYHKPSIRKRLLEKAIKELIGKLTSSGAIIDRYEFLRTANDQDWKLIVRAKKGKSPHFKSYSKPPKEVTDRVEQPSPKKSKAKPNLDQQLNTFEKSPKAQKKESQKEVNPTTKSTSYKPSVGSEVEQILEHFRTVNFEGNTDFNFNKKDVKKALALLEKYGLEKTLAIITQAKTLTDNDGFRPRTLTGIGSYINDALKLAEKDARQAKIDRRNTDNLLKQRRENLRIDHQKLYSEQYYQYVEDVLNVLVIRLPLEYQAFEEQEAQQKEQLKADIESVSGSMKKIKQTQLVFFNRPREKARRANSFFLDKKISIPDFWQWDKDTNPENLELRIESDLV